MNLLTTIVLLWLVSTPLSYLWMRQDHRATCGKWKRIDRLCALALCLAYGPVMLLIIGIVAVFSRLSASAWANREARW